MKDNGKKTDKQDLMSDLPLPKKILIYSYAFLLIIASILFVVWFVHDIISSWGECRVNIYTHEPTCAEN